MVHGFDGNVASAARPSLVEKDGMMPLIRLHDFQAQFGLHQPYRNLAKHLQIAGTFSRQNWMGLRWPRPSSLPLGPLRLLRNEIFTKASSDMANQDARFVACTAELHRHTDTQTQRHTDTRTHTLTIGPVSFLLSFLCT